MDRSIEFFLLTPVKYQDEMLQWHDTVRERRVFGQLSSVSASEFFAGGQNGLKPELRFVMFGPDYCGEKLIKFEGEIYSVYRTYMAKNDMIEIYTEKRAGNAKS